MVTRRLATLVVAVVLGPLATRAEPFSADDPWVLANRLVTVSIEAICDGQKVLGAARAEVDLGLRVPHPDHESAACYAP